MVKTVCSSLLFALARTYIVKDTVKHLQMSIKYNLTCHLGLCPENYCQIAFYLVWEEKLYRIGFQRITISHPATIKYTTPQQNIHLSTYNTFLCNLHIWPLIFLPSSHCSMFHFRFFKCYQPYFDE